MLPLYQPMYIILLVQLKAEDVIIFLCKFLKIEVKMIVESRNCTEFFRYGLHPCRPNLVTFPFKTNLCKGESL